MLHDEPGKPVKIPVGKTIKIPAGVTMTISVEEEVPVDPSQFGDPLAERTAWTPVEKSGSNYRTHRLARIDANRIEFRVAFEAMVLYGIFLVAGIVLIIVFTAAILINDDSFWTLAWPLMLGGPLVTIGASAMYFGSEPITFDKIAGYYWRGRTSPERVLDKSSLKDYTSLAGIHALQILSERVSRSKGTYTSYELNLVLEDGTRVNVIDHYNLEKLRMEAAAIAEFLGKPLWDAVR